MTTHRVGVLLLVAACGTVDANDQLPYRTVSDTVGDTVVARTTGTVPDSLVRRLTLEWRAEVDPNDTASIGDVSDIEAATDGRVYVWDHATPALWIVDDAGKSLKRVGICAAPLDRLRAKRTEDPAFAGWLASINTAIWITAPRTRSVSLRGLGRSRPSRPP